MENTGYQDAVQEQAARDGGLTGNDDPYVSFYHDVPRELAEEAMSKERAHPCRREALATRRVAERANEIRALHRGPLLPRPTSFAVVAERLNITPDEIASGHCPALSRPQELSDLLEG